MSNPNENKAIADFIAPVSATDGFSKPTTKSTTQESKEEATTTEKSEKEAHKPMTYEERLVAAKLTRSEALSIIDDICDKSSYLRKVVIRKESEGKKERAVVFSTVPAVVQAYITTKATAFAKTPIIFDAMASRLRAAASILVLNDIKFTAIENDATEEQVASAMEHNMRLVDQIPAPLLQVILNKLGEFDIQVATALSEGYADFF